MKRGSNFAALAAYLAISAAFFAPSLWNHFSTRLIGVGPDPTIYMWFLKWWPHAIAHGLNPLITHSIWVPIGVNLAWTTCFPLLALALSPITELWGPVPAYNIACLLVPALAAWAAFQLCLYVTRRFWPALLGGYVFGFSTYVLAQLRGHLVEILIFPIPLMVLIVLRRLHDELSPRAFTAWLTLLLLVQFLLCVEQVATLTFFAGLTLMVALIAGDRDLRSRIYTILPWIALSYGLVFIILIPYVYAMFAHGFPHGTVWQDKSYSADLINFIVPTHVNQLGTISWFESLSRNCLGNVFEDSAYLGWPLILLALWFGISRWRRPAVRVMLLSLLLICVLAMGRVLHIEGVETIWLPWTLFVKLPLLAAALPCRFVAYAFLVLAIMTALYLSEVNKAPGIGLSALIVFCLLPNFDGEYWTDATQTPTFFTDGIYRKYIRRNDVIMVLPPRDRSNAMLWQAETDMYFRMAGGYAGPDQKWSGEWQPQWDGDRCEPFKFMGNARVSAIVLGDSGWMVGGEVGLPELDRVNLIARMYMGQLDRLGLKGEPIGDIVFYPVPPQLIAPFTLPHREIEDREFSSLESRVNRAIRYAAECLPKDAMPPKSDLAQWRAITTAAAASSDDPYSCGAEVTARLGSADRIRLTVIAPREQLDRLQQDYRSVASVTTPENRSAMTFTSADFAPALTIELSRAEISALANRLTDSSAATSGSLRVAGAQCDPSGNSNGGKQEQRRK